MWRVAVIRVLINLIVRISRLEVMMAEVSSDQQHLNDDVAALTESLTGIEAEIANLKEQHPNVDFSDLDNLVARAKGDVTPDPVQPPPADNPTV